MCAATKMSPLDSEPLLDLQEARDGGSTVGVTTQAPHGLCGTGNNLFLAQRICGLLQGEKAR